MPDNWEMAQPLSGIFRSMACAAAHRGREHMGSAGEAPTTGSRLGRRQLYVPNVDGCREERMKVAHGSAEAEGLPEGAHESGRYMFERLYYWTTSGRRCSRIARSSGGAVSSARRAENITHKYGLLDPTTGDKLEGKDVVYLDLAGPFTPAPSGESSLRGGSQGKNRLDRGDAD